MIAQNYNSVEFHRHGCIFLLITELLRQQKRRWIIHLPEEIADFSANQKLVAVAAVARTRLVNDEAHHLTLFDVVKCHNADKAVGVLRAALLHFAQHFLRRGAVEHRQLPHRPVVLLRCRRLTELNAREVTLLNRVLDLTSNLSIGQRRQVGKRLKTLLFG